MTSGDQFKPIEMPYLRMWRERLEAEKLAKAVKSVVKKRKKAKKSKAQK